MMGSQLYLANYCHNLQCRQIHCLKALAKSVNCWSAEFYDKVYDNMAGLCERILLHLYDMYLYINIYIMWQISRSIHSYTCMEILIHTKGRITVYKHKMLDTSVEHSKFFRRKLYFFTTLHSLYLICSHCSCFTKY